MRKILLLAILFLSCLSFVIAQQQIENPGFEQWENVGMGLTEPVEWSSIKTSDNTITNNSAPLVWSQSTDAHSGNYSVMLNNVSIFGIVATGTLTNGRVHAEFNPDSGYVYTRHDSTQWNTVFTGRPDSLTGWFKYFPVNNDHGGVRAILHVNDGAFPPNGTEPNWIAEANFNLPAYTIETWTRFSVPFTYYSQSSSQYLLIVLKAGNGTEAVAESYVLFDDFQLIYNDPGGMADLVKEEPFMDCYGRTVRFISLSDESRRKAIFRLFDLTGHPVYEIRSPDPFMTLPPHLPEGIYVGMLVEQKGIRSQKIFLN